MTVMPLPTLLLVLFDYVSVLKTDSLQLHLSQHYLKLCLILYFMVMRTLCSYLACTVKFLQCHSELMNAQIANDVCFVEQFI